MKRLLAFLFSLLLALTVVSCTPAKDSTAQPAALSANMSKGFRTEEAFFEDAQKAQVAQENKTDDYYGLDSSQFPFFYKPAVMPAGYSVQDIILSANNSVAYYYGPDEEADGGHYWGIFTQYVDFPLTPEEMMEPYRQHADSYAALEIIDDTYLYIVPRNVANRTELMWCVEDAVISLVFPRDGEYSFESPEEALQYTSVTRVDVK